MTTTLDLPNCNTMRAAQIRRLQQIRDRGEVVSEITIQADAVDGVDFRDLPITVGKVTRHYRVISAAWWHWEGVGGMVTLGLYLKNQVGMYHDPAG